jgi:hypothetical protein
LYSRQSLETCGLLWQKSAAAAMLAVVPPISMLARSRAVAREPTPGAQECRSCCTDRARITANHRMQFDFQNHPFESLRIQQIHDWTFGEVKQPSFVFALAARCGEEAQTRWFCADVLPQSRFEVSNCGARGQNAVFRFAAQHEHTYPHRHVGERRVRVCASRQSRAEIAAWVHIGEFIA